MKCSHCNREVARHITKGPYCSVACKDQAEDAATIERLKAELAEAREKNIAFEQSQFEEIVALQTELAETHERATEDFMSMRGIDSAEQACDVCQGVGYRTYANTSTWRGGIGGQALTTAVCDSCWGSGRKNQPWPSHMEVVALRAEIQRKDAALRFYADEDTWYATTLITDPPCGEIVSDYSVVNGVERLGKRARAALSSGEGEEPTKPVQCPECEGTGRPSRFEDEHGNEIDRCELCGGGGEVNPTLKPSPTLSREAAERIARGRMARIKDEMMGAWQDGFEAGLNGRFSILDAAQEESRGA